MSATENFIKKSRNVHGDKYDYNKVCYIDSRTKVCIICPEHGEFWQEPSSHIRGYGCPKCANKERGDKKRMTREEFINRSKEVHGYRYDYSKVEYVNSNTEVCIICPEHGEFWQKPVVHIKQKSGCPKCVGRYCTNEEFIRKARMVHGNKYDYSKVEYTKAHNKVCIICPEHGEFWQEPSKHLLGQGCRECGKLKISKKNKLTTDEFIKKAKLVHGEKDIKEFLNKNGIKYIDKDREILDGSEIDIFILEKNIGIEFDGLYWHSELFKENRYHLNKTERSLEKGIRLIHIFEDEWLRKSDIVKSMLLNALGKTNKRIFARKCEIKEIDSKTSKEFLENNHIQGSIGSKINIGLYYENELVSVMCFGKKRLNLGYKKDKIQENQYEMFRFCNKINTVVIGGASKLLKYFIDKYNPEEIVSYCDRRYGTGNMYKKLGFKLDHVSKPNYFYIEGTNRNNRFKYRKSELVKMGFDKNKSEKEIMLERKIYRIYDCGTLVYVWKKEGA